MNRRFFLQGLAIGIMFFLLGRSKILAAETKTFPFQLTDAEWKKCLSPDAYRILRKQGTERPFSSLLNKEKRKGLFHCAGCDWLLYASDHKYESHTGWPSFWQPATDQAVGTSTDYLLLYPRTEVHCANCGGHLGHIFDDGPPPTGKRHCINGIALVFKPQE